MGDSYFFSCQLPLRLNPGKSIAHINAETAEYKRLFRGFPHGIGHLEKSWDLFYFAKSGFSHSQQDSNPPLKVKSDILLIRVLAVEKEEAGLLN
jgi:hypothetical protein